jgi:hypothetical protein
MVDGAAEDLPEKALLAKALLALVIVLLRPMVDNPK